MAVDTGLVHPVEYPNQVKKEAHSVETPLKHGLRGEIFRRFAERRLYLHLSRVCYSER